jgi:ABC-type antimicrobial peptide transport system permease subunit
MIFGESALLLAMGVGFGTALAVVVLQPVAGLLYGVGPLDRLSFAVGTGALVLVALLSVWAPARSASSVAPIVALRE